MRVVIVGPGALGRVYGARLALLGDCDVRVVGRIAGPAREVRLERVDDGGALTWRMPEALERAPADADVVLVCVRYEHLDAVPARLTAGRAPVIAMTPMLPRDHARVSAALPDRVRVGMPGVVAYENDAHAVRYWLPRLATTLVEAPAQGDGPEGELVRRLGRAGIGARAQAGVLERNVATTVSFVPFAMALDAGGSIDGVLRDPAMLRLALDAAEEGRALGRAVGKAEAWAATLLRFVGPLALKAGVGVARVRAPEAVRYVEEHFGRKLHSQNTAMAAGIVALAEDMGVRHEALLRLQARLTPSGA